MTRVDDDNAEYSASNVDNAISVCKNDFQIKGQGPKKIVNIVRDLADDDDVSGSTLYNPAKSA